MYLDKHFYYADNKLSDTNHIYNKYLLKPMLMQGITRTRNKLVLVVVDNKDLFENMSLYQILCKFLNFRIPSQIYLKQASSF